MTTRKRPASRAAAQHAAAARGAAERFWRDTAQATGKASVAAHIGITLLGRLLVQALTPAPPAEGILVLLEICDAVTREAIEVGVKKPLPAELTPGLLDPSLPPPPGEVAHTATLAGAKVLRQSFGLGPDTETDKAKICLILSAFTGFLLATKLPEPETRQAVRILFFRRLSERLEKELQK